MRHNGTAMERVVNASWRCVFPQGNCFANHAPLEGLPEKMQNCITEKSVGPLQVQIIIDLHCAKMDNSLHCDSTLKQTPFDPFYTCTNDPNVVKATCRISCVNNYPVETCLFQFDSQGIFNMSDETIDICRLEAECMSPYVESNTMFCSGHKSAGEFKPHWESRPTPNRVYATHGIRGSRPTPAPPQGESAGSELLWFIAMLVLAVSGLAAATRMGYFPQLAKWFDALSGSARSVPRFGTPYQAPSVTGQSGRSMQYVAPSVPQDVQEINKHRDGTQDQELRPLAEPS
mmetsp:Transcript_90040/g.159460  ORF Transcript_90040/g.159460 Transcript_90040/m.159460 type:complete len:288 (+) Transcript_90040:432-1295(+)